MPECANVMVCQGWESSVRSCPGVGVDHRRSRAAQLILGNPGISKGPAFAGPYMAGDRLSAAANPLQGRKIRTLEVIENIRMDFYPLRSLTDVLHLWSGQEEAG